MRQIIVQVPREHTQAALAAASGVEAVNVARWEARADAGEIDLVLLHVNNAAVEAFLARLSEIPDARASFLPSGVITLYPPASAAPDQVRDVEARSPVEVFLSGLQSIGSWTGFLTYAGTSGLVVWIALYTNTSYMLVAAMLIAPFAGPAMNAAVGTARGDRALLGRSVLRYGAGLAVAVAVSALLTWLFKQDTPSPLTIETSQLSATSVLLPLSAGVAGAVQLVQSERSSLVTGAAVGMLVAASIAPPTGIAGIGLALGRADMVTGSLFQLLLQFAAINLAATLVFRLYGLSERGARYERGERRVSVLSSAFTTLALAAMLVWQFSDSPALQRMSAAQRATADIHQALASDTRARLIRAEVNFTRSGPPGRDILLCVLHVQREPGAPAPGDLRAALTGEVQSLLLREGYEVTPLVDVRVLEPPSMIR